MDQKITDFLIKEFKIGKLRLAPLDLLLLIGTTLAAIMLRYSVAGYESLDNAGFSCMAGQMQIMGIFFDVALAVLAALMVKELTGSRIRSFMAYGLVLVLPVLVAESVMWEMGDSSYVFFALLGLYLTMKGYGNYGLAVYGFSLFQSTNALFLLPVFLLFFFRGKNNFVAFLIPVAGTVLGVLCRIGIIPWKPGFMTAQELLANSRPNKLLSYNYPNFYQMIGPDKFVGEYGIVAICALVGVVAAVLVVLIQTEREWGNREWIFAALFFTMFIPFLAPYMDERSGMLADLLAVIVALSYIKKFYYALVQVTLSYIAYSCYFRGESVIPLGFVALVAFALLLDVMLTTGVILGKKETENASVKGI